MADGLTVKGGYGDETINGETWGRGLGTGFLTCKEMGLAGRTTRRRFAEFNGKGRAEKINQDSTKRPHQAWCGGAYPDANT